MKKTGALLLMMLALIPAVAAQEFYTLPEIREQAAKGWHETYTDKYGRTVQVDIDIEVFGEEKAPVIKACWGDPPRCHWEENEPFAEIKKARIKRNGVSTYLYNGVVGMKVDPDRKYTEDYGNDLTLREVYDYLKELLREQGVNQEYLWEQPCTFSILYSAHKDTGEVLVPALYSVMLWQTEFGLPILTHVGNSFGSGTDAPVVVPEVSFSMSNRHSYIGDVKALDVKEILAEDIPLCSVDKAIEGTRKMIEAGYIKEVFDLRFGYVVYTNPDDALDKRRSSYDVNTWYLVPSWVMYCRILEDPKVDQLPEYPRLWEVTINVQTGEMMDYFDTSLYKGGDARYKGFISWDDVK